MRILLICLVFFTSLATSLAQTTDNRFAFNQFSGEIKSPSAFFGYELGTRFTEYEKSVAYFNYLAEASPRIYLEEYGRTYEDRPLLLLTISSEENIRNRKAIQQRHAQMPEAYLLSRKEQDAFLDEPVVTSFSYNIHGNEASNTEAAQQVAYELALTNDPAMLDALDQSVILLFVCINPDGRNRYISWYNTVTRATGGESPADLEHHAPWPNGRTNHYWFDLNRDWVWGVHPESRGHTAAYQAWMPQVHADYHEQGYHANYFTMPGTTPRNALLPDTYEAWTDTFGMANISAFNEKAITYFTRDRFDFYYPSYGSSYPSVMGAVGMLTEQGGIGAGRAVETEDGYVLTLKQRVFDHYLTSLASIKAAARNRKKLLQYSLDAWNPLNSKAAANAYLIENDGSEFLKDFVDVMLLNNIEMELTTEPLTAKATPYRTGKETETTFAKGSIIIPTEQARHLFVNSLLGRNLAIEDSVMYDMATWSAPLAYNLEAYTLDGSIQVDTEPVKRNPFTFNGQVKALSNSKPLYAAVIENNQRNTPKALAALWKAGLRVRSSHEPFSSWDGTRFSAGSLIILAGRNLDKDLPTILADIAEETDVVINTFDSGRMLEGMDLGSTRNVPLKQPKVALLVEPPFNTYTSGQLYFLFDQEVRLPVDRIRISKLEQTALPKFGSRYGYADLNDYDVLILPGANRLTEVWKDKSLERLTDWIRRGGIVVALENSALFFTKEGKVSAQLVRKPVMNRSKESALLQYADREEYRGKRRIPGSALRATIDQTHPLAFGVKNEVYTLKFGTEALMPNINLESVGRYIDDPEQLLTAGYASEANLKSLAGHTWAGVQSFGKGKIVYLLDNPHYRMFWRGPSRMTVNAVMWLPGF